MQHQHNIQSPPMRLKISCSISLESGTLPCWTISCSIILSQGCWRFPSFSVWKEHNHILFNVQIWLSFHRYWPTGSTIRARTCVHNFICELRQVDDWHWTCDRRSVYLFVWQLYAAIEIDAHCAVDGINRKVCVVLSTCSIKHSLIIHDSEK
jgi:hypothetical protein